MQVFTSRYGESLQRILSAYPPGSNGLIAALETICQNAYKDGEQEGRKKTADDVCEHLHQGPPSGLKCLSCYHAEVNYSDEQVVLAEMEAFKREQAQHEGSD